MLKLKFIHNMKTNMEIMRTQVWIGLDEKFNSFLERLGRAKREQLPRKGDLKWCSDTEPGFKTIYIILSFFCLLWLIICWPFCSRSEPTCSKCSFKIISFWLLFWNICSRLWSCSRSRSLPGLLTLFTKMVKRNKSIWKTLYS